MILSILFFNMWLYSYPYEMHSNQIWSNPKRHKTHYSIIRMQMEFFLNKLPKNHILVIPEMILKWWCLPINTINTLSAYDNLAACNKWCTSIRKSYLIGHHQRYSYLLKLSIITSVSSYFHFSMGFIDYNDK